jgi:hypothetical protein
MYVCALVPHAVTLPAAQGALNVPPFVVFVCVYVCACVVLSGVCLRLCVYTYFYLACARR